MMNGHKYCETEIEWLSTNIHKYGYAELTKMFNAQFSTDLGVCSIQSACLRRGITHGIVQKSHHEWTECEIEWLRVNIHKYSYKKLAKAFNSHYGTNLSVASIEHACLKRGINHGRQGEHGFVKGEHNDYSQSRPLFSERTDSRGRVFIKVKDEPCKGNHRRGDNWVQKDRYIWEQVHGCKLTSNDLIIHLNQDKADCSIENLYKTTRAVARILAAYHWYFKDRQMTLTAIKHCELKMALK